MKIIVAPNSFKNSINAVDAAKAISCGLKDGNSTIETVLLPIADGGDHTLETLLDLFKGESMVSAVKDPMGRDIQASWGLIDKRRVAVIEFAKASGLHLMNKRELNPMRASSIGAGQLMKNALDRNVEDIWLGIGGSATVDGGSGMLQALGFEFLDNLTKPVAGGAKGLMKLKRIRNPFRDNPLKTKITVLCDVDNPLLGENGAARVFGPQKGADANMLIELEKGLKNLVKVVFEETGKDVSSIKHGGASGGVAAILYAFFDAELVSGIDFILEKLNFRTLLSGNDLLITAEGKIDDSTFRGKAPAGAAKLAQEAGLPVIALTGNIEDCVDPGYFDAIFPIGACPRLLEESLKHTAEDLYRTSRQIGRILLMKNRQGET